MRDLSPYPICSANRSSGFSLVELLVAMGIGLLGILVIMQAFSMNERYKENTVGASGAQTNGNIALFTIERDVRMAGFGITNTAALGCSSIQYQYNGTYSSPPGPAAGALPTLRFVPVVIDQGAAGASDTITTLSSSNAYRTSPASLTDDMPPTSSELKVANGMGFELNDLAIATQGSTCSLMEITQIQDPASHYQHAPGTSKFNPPGGVSLLPGYTVGAQIFTIGKPLMRVYTVSSNSLTVRDWNALLTGTAATPIVDEIVDLQADYGKDTDGDSVIDTYDTVTPTTTAGWTSTLVIRMAVLARGAYQRPNVAGVCTATLAANMPTWAGGTLNDPDVPAGNPSCYRYRVFETTIPIRNMIWRSDR